MQLSHSFNKVRLRWRVSGQVAAVGAACALLVTPWYWETPFEWLIALAGLSWLLWLSAHCQRGWQRGSYWALHAALTGTLYGGLHLEFSIYTSLILLACTVTTLAHFLVMSLHGYLAPSPRTYLLTAPLALVAAETLSRPLLFWEDISVVIISIAYTQVASPLLPVAALSEQSALTLVTAFTAVAVVLLFLRCYRASVVVLAGVAGLFWLSVSLYPTVPATEAAPLQLGLAQDNWTNDELRSVFDDAAMFSVLIERYRDLHQQAAAENLDLTVFAESALPGVTTPAALPGWENSLRGLPPALLGAFFGEAHLLQRPRIRSAEVVQSFVYPDLFINDYRKLTSSALLWDGQDLTKVYEKRKLVPVYEMYDKGEKRPLTQIAGQTFGVLICYDSLMPSIVLEQLRQGATFIVISSNTNFFEGTPTPRAHLRGAQLIAASSRKYVSYVSHRGTSAIAAPDGRLIVRSQPQQVQLIHAEIVPNTVMTLYARAGEWLAVLALVVMFFWTAYTLYQRRVLTKAKGAVSRVLSRLH